MATKNQRSNALSVGLITAAFLIATQARSETPQPSINGELRVWHPLTFSFTGPSASETDDGPNPFLDYRLKVAFAAPDGATFDVQGFFDGDGEGGSRGNVWRVRFSPNQAGQWSYRASFRQGDHIAIEHDSSAGLPVAFDGATGSFTVKPRNPAALGFLKWGRLEYVGKHYLKFRDGPYWIRGGTDTPENFLAYLGFDDTIPSHAFEAHRGDWHDGDLDWGDGRGRAIIGVLNYLASKHVNSIYVMTMNVGGDGKDVWPWAERPKRNGSADNDNLHYDVSKLGQWDRVFAHAQSQGIFLHLVLNEGEEANKRELDDGELDVERKLYYRELVARFGHHLALEWNLCEEYNLQFDLGADRIRQFAQYIQAIDPYHHPITVHSAGDPLKELRFLFGDDRFSMTSIQLNQRRIDQLTESFRSETTAAGRPLPVSMDEFTIDAGQEKSWHPVDDAERHRKQKLWPTYLSGGMIEFILEDLLDVETFKTDQREALWSYMWYARQFMENELPYWEMQPNDNLVRGAATIDVGVGKGKTSPMGAQVFCLPAEVYAIYLPKASSTGELNLAGTTRIFQQRWYDPRAGKFRGNTRTVRGGDWVPLGKSPAEPEQDWVVLVKAADDDGRALRRSVSEASAALPCNDQIVAQKARFPTQSWEEVPAGHPGLNPKKLDQLAVALGGRGAVVKDGYVARRWGDQAEKSDWYSAAKPVLGTLLLFAIAEGKADGVDMVVSDFGWELSAKDRQMTLRHLANMTSGYARPEPPGEAWSYNDFGVQLYQKTIFDRIFDDTPSSVANDSQRFGALDLEDGLSFAKKNRRIRASVRDFARISWFWLQRGNWTGQQLIPRNLFDDVMRPQVPTNLPHTAKAETNDYLQIGSFGGGSDHFTKYGAGIYGFNWWFNTVGRLHPNERTWPDAPEDLVMAIGFGGNCCALLPSANAILVAADADWDNLEAGVHDSQMNRVVSLFADAVTSD